MLYRHQIRADLKRLTHFRRPRPGGETISVASMPPAAALVPGPSKGGLYSAPLGVGAVAASVGPVGPPQAPRRPGIEASRRIEPRGWDDMPEREV